METTKTLNELLVRFDDNGAFQGAHAVYLYKVYDGPPADPATKMVSASLGNPVAIAKVDVADRAKLVAVVGEAMVALAEAREAAEVDAQAKAGELAAKNAELAAKDATAQELLAAKDEAERRAADYAGQLAAISLESPALEPVK